MEPDRAINSALSAIGEISADDLDEMLQLDELVPTQASDIMTNNREDLPSQFCDFDRISDSDISNLFHEESANSMEDNSVLIKTPYMEHIDVEDSMGMNLNESVTPSNSKSNVNPSNRSNLPPSQSSMSWTNQSHLDTTFDKMFQELDETDFELNLFDEETVATLEQDITTQLENLKELRANTNDQMKSNTQMLPPKAASSKLQNITTSCPNFTKDSHSSSEVPQKSSEQNDEISALELDYRPSCSTKLNREITKKWVQSIPDQSIADTTDDITDKDPSTNENIPLNYRKAINRSTRDPTSIPLTVQQLYDLMKEQYSDFSFVYAISAQLCQDRVPMGCFVNVKMALLLSIASIGKNPDIAPIPIIVMGNDPYMANLLIKNIAELANRFVGPVDDTKHPSMDGFRNRNWIEADPIQLAKGGVFYVGEWACLKAQRSEKIFKDIETSRVAVERATRIYPLQTAIWAHWRALKYNSKDQQTFNKFVKIFGIPVYLDNNNDEALVDFLLKQASTESFESTIDYLSISADEMRSFLAVISARTVDFTQEAVDLLQKYFVASRTERPDCLTKQAYTILKQFSESFAKISLRHEVLAIDVVGAIFLCEHFILHLYGVGADPPPMLEPVSFVGHVDAYIAKFHEWLKSYIMKYNERD